jgi:hypothetical protein
MYPYNHVKQIFEENKTLYTCNIYVDLDLWYSYHWYYKLPAITVATRSEAWTVFARLNAEVVGSKPTRSMDVCVWVYSFFVSSLKIAALRRADHSPKESYRLCKKDYWNEEEARAQQRSVKPLMSEWINFEFPEGANKTEILWMLLNCNGHNRIS